MVKISEKARKQRTYSIVGLIFIAITVGIFANANNEKEGVFSDEAKLIRKCKKDAKKQIARILIQEKDKEKALKTLRDSFNSLKIKGLGLYQFFSFLKV